MGIKEKFSEMGIKEKFTLQNFILVVGFILWVIGIFVGISVLLSGDKLVPAEDFELLQQAKDVNLHWSCPEMYKKEDWNCYPSFDSALIIGDKKFYWGEYNLAGGAYVTCKELVYVEDSKFYCESDSFTEDANITIEIPQLYINSELVVEARKVKKE